MRCDIQCIVKNVYNAAQNNFLAFKNMFLILLIFRRASWTTYFFGHFLTGQNQNDEEIAAEVLKYPVDYLLNTFSEL